MAAIDTTSAFFLRETVAQIPEELLLKRNNISTLALHEIDGTSLRDFLQLFPNVRKLVILECDLSGTQDEVFKLTQLEELDLSGNKSFGVLCPEIGQLRRLKKLNLSWCFLESLPGEFGQLESLEELDLSLNKSFGVLCPEIGQLRRLKKLELNNCGLKCLPEEFGQLESFELVHGLLLEELDLSWNKSFGVLCPEIGQLRRLKKLKLYNCGLKCLPGEFGQLESLEELDLSYNKSFGVLCPAIGQLRRLKKLSLSWCRLESLPGEIGQLETLEDLNLSGNESIGVLCPAIGKLRRLKKLDLGNCGLKCLPGELGQLETLEDLDLGNNELIEFPNAVLKLTKLRRLDLRNILTRGRNCITDLPVALWNSPLNELLLHGNPLAMPPEGIWKQGMSAIRTYLYDKINKRDEESVNEFLNCLRLRDGSNRSPSSALRKRLKAARPSLIDRLDDTTLKQILDHFVAARDGEGLITDQQFEYVQSKQTRSDRNRAFLEVVHSRGLEAINLLAEILQNVCHMPDLAELLRVDTGP